MSTIKTSVKTTYEIEYLDYYGDPINMVFDNKEQYEETLKDLKLLESGGYKAAYERLAERLDGMERPDYYPHDEIFEALDPEEARLLSKLPTILDNNIWLNGNSKDNEWVIHTGCNDDLIKVIRLFAEMGWFNGLDPRYDVPMRESEDQPEDERITKLTAFLTSSLGYEKGKEVLTTIAEYSNENVDKENVIYLGSFKSLINKEQIKCGSDYFDKFCAELINLLIKLKYFKEVYNPYFYVYKAIEKIEIQPETELKRTEQ